MEVEHAILADYAATTNDGKLIVAGIFSALFMGQFPNPHPHMALALRIHIQPGEAPKHALVIRLVDADGNAVLEVDGQVEVDHVEGKEGAYAQVVLALNNVVFPKAGPYSFDVLINGRFEHRVPLAVHELTDEMKGRVHRR